MKHWRKPRSRNSLYELTMDQEIITTILADTFSLTQFKTRVRLLKASLLKAFFGGENEGLAPYPHDLNWLKALPDSFYQKFTKDNMYQIFTTIEQEVAKLPVLTIYLTFETDNATISSIGTFARKMFGPTIMLDLKFDPNLIAGTALAWKGVYKDYSLRAKIESNKDEILQNFKKFLR